MALRDDNGEKPRVFVSSVMLDYASFRRAARDGIVAAGAEPVLAEDFPAGPESPRTACLDGVASCDAVVVVLGARGGWVAPSGKPVVREEAEEARRRKLPLLLFRQRCQRDDTAARLDVALSDYIHGTFRKDFADESELQALVTRAVAALDLRSSSAMSLGDWLSDLPNWRQEVNLRVRFVPQRRDELIEPRDLGSDRLRLSIMEVGHSEPWPMFDWLREKTVSVLPEAWRLVQSDAGKHNAGSSVSRVVVEATGSVTMDSNITGRHSRELDGLSPMFCILQQDIQNALTRSLTFMSRLYDRLDLHGRYTQFLFNAAMTGVGSRLVYETAPKGSVSMRLTEDEQVVAFDAARVASRDDLRHPEREIENVVAVLKRRTNRGLR